MSTRSLHRPTPLYAYLPPGRRYRRQERIEQMIASSKTFTIADMLRDSLNTEALEDQPRFRGWTSNDAAIERARAMVADARTAGVALVLVSRSYLLRTGPKAGGGRR